MYKLKKEDFIPKESYQRDRSYFIDVFRKLKAKEDDLYFYLPDEVVTQIAAAEISTEVYNFFELVWSNEEKKIGIEDVVGSHDYRNYELKTWLANFLYNGITKENFDKYLENPMAIFEAGANSLKTFEKDGKYYLADGHHRFSCLYLHYHILKSQNKLPESFKGKIPTILRTIPNDLDFVSRFVRFCAMNNLYSEDEVGIIPEFKLIDSNPDNPVIMHIESKVKITKDSNLDEILKEIKKEAERNKNK